MELDLRMDSRTLRNSRVPTAVSVRRGVKTKYVLGEITVILYFLGERFLAKTKPGMLVGSLMGAAVDMRSVGRSAVVIQEKEAHRPNLIQGQQCVLEYLVDCVQH